MTTESTETVEDVRHEFEEFKRKVAVVAASAKRKHGWCEEVDRLLIEELGIKPVDRRARVTFEVSVPHSIDPDDLNSVRTYLEDFGRLHHVTTGIVEVESAL